MAGVVKVIEAPVGATLGRDNLLIPRKTIASTARSYTSGLALTTPSLGANGLLNNAEQPALTDYAIQGDAVPSPLTDRPGDPARGRAIALDRREGNCLICHQFPVDEPFQGDLAPDLRNIGERLSAGQIRLRLIDASRINPATIMPPYYRVAGLRDVAPEYEGKPALDAQQIEDVVAYLVTLTDR